MTCFYCKENKETTIERVGSSLGLPVLRDVCEDCIVMLSEKGEE